MDVEERQVRVANPRDIRHTKECAREVERGLKSKISVKIRQKRQHNEDRRNADILNLREHIVQELLSSKIVTETEHGISTINPGILKILEIKHIENVPRQDIDPRTDTEGEGTDSRTSLEKQIEGLDEALRKLDKESE